jgi:hypothetical protein
VRSAAALRTARSFLSLARGADWWESKLPFLVAVTVLIAPSTSASKLLGIAGTVVAGAAFGFGVNEVADRTCDARAGKLNRAAGLPRWEWMTFLTFTAAVAFGLSLLWAADAAGPALVVLSLAVAWAYSVRPIRFKERGRAGLATAALAQWALPVLVVSAVAPGGWHHIVTWLFVTLSVAIGFRWIAIHQLSDAAADRRAGIAIYLSRRSGGHGFLTAVFAGELLLLMIALASTWPHSLPAAVALGVYAVYELSGVASPVPLPDRLSGYAHAPMAAYYFDALPLALAAAKAVGHSASPTTAVLLALLAVPLLVTSLKARLRSEQRYMLRAIASMQRLVLRAREPQQWLRSGGPPQ